MAKSLEEKVQELWDREQIKSLTYAYGHWLEKMDSEALSRLFTEDGAMDFSSVGWGIKKGRPAIEDFYPTTWDQRVKPFFTITTSSSTTPPTRTDGGGSTTGLRRTIRA